MLIFTFFLNVKNFETSPFFSEANSYKYHIVLKCVVCRFIYCIMYFMSRKFIKCNLVRFHNNGLFI